MDKLKIVPILRFPGFSDNWLSEQFNETVDAKSSKYNPLKGTKAIKCIELEHLSSETGELLGYTDGQHSGSIKNVFHKGDVLFGKLRPYLRKYLLAPFDGVCSSEIWVLKSKNGINSFLYYIVQSDAFIDLTSISTGSKMPRADWNVVSNGVFHYPSIPEQQKIASFLTSVDDKIQQLNKKKALLEQYKKGVMQQLFSQQLRFKDDQGNTFPDWEEKTMREIAKFYSGGTPTTGKAEYYDGEIPFIKSGEINALITAQTITSSGLVNSSAKMVEIGDILYALYGATSGEIAISKIKGAINQAVLCIKSEHNSYFLMSFLRLNKQAIIGTYLQGGQGNLSAEIVKSIGIRIPCFAEQNKIASFLSAIDDKINGVSQQIEQTRQFKKGLLQQMFI